jgi:hypothetical protein
MTPSREVAMSTAPAPPAETRHPLSLPPGSVRAVLALMIAGLFWGCVAMPETKDVPVPLFLYFLLGLILLFFGAHGHSIGPHLGDRRHPLGLPRGSIRAILLLGMAAVLGWIYYAHPERLPSRLTPDPDQLKQWPTLLTATVAGFALGYLVRLGPWRTTAAFQDLLAWVSLLAMLGLVFETVWVIFINPSLFERQDLATWEAILTAVVSFYFGARS